MRLSIVIVSWNTRKRLDSCLKSLERELCGDATSPIGAAAEVFVVDNASADASARMVREQFPWVRLVENPTNAGFAAACNQAIRESTGQYVLLLNPDTEVQPGALAELTRFMDGEPRAGAVGARLLNTDGSLQAWCAPAPTLSREVWRLFHLDFIRPYAVYDMARWNESVAREVDMVPGTCMLMRRSALVQIGLLDERYFIYSEEVDLCQRLRQRGWGIFWVPRSVVVHHAGQSTRQVAAPMFIRLYQGKILYFRKHYGRLTASAYKLIIAAAAVCRLLISPFIWLETPSKRQRHLALVGHYGRLLRALPRL